MTIEIYTDASRNGTCYSVAYSMEDGEGYVENASSDMGAISSVEAEYRAIKEAVYTAKREKNVDQGVRIYSDCKPIVEKLNSPEEVSLDWFRRVMIVRQNLNDFDWWRIDWISREENTDVHRLAWEKFQAEREKYM